MRDNVTDTPAIRTRRRPARTGTRSSLGPGAGRLELPDPGRPVRARAVLQLDRAAAARAVGRRRPRRPPGLRWRPPGTGRCPSVSDPAACLVRRQGAGRRTAQYCVRVRARSDRDAKRNQVLSEWTQLGGDEQSRLQVRAAAPATPAGPASRMPAMRILEPLTGTVTRACRSSRGSRSPAPAATSSWSPRTPPSPRSSTWRSRISRCTRPRRHVAQTYPDETTSYYWAVVPASGANGCGVAQPSRPQNNPRAFQKRSFPPDPADAGGGRGRHRPAGVPLDVDRGRAQLQPPGRARTRASATCSTTSRRPRPHTRASPPIPADTVLYWRVRANDENLRRPDLVVGRHVPAAPADPEALRGQPDRRRDDPGAALAAGRGRDVLRHARRPVRRHAARTSTCAGPPFTPAIFYGTGIWHWQVRANFPTGPAPRGPGRLHARAAVHATHRDAQQPAGGQPRAPHASAVGPARMAQELPRRDLDDRQLHAARRSDNHRSHRVGAEADPDRVPRGRQVLLARRDRRRGRQRRRLARRHSSARSGASSSCERASRRRRTTSLVRVYVTRRRGAAASRGEGRRRPVRAPHAGRQDQPRGRRRCSRSARASAARSSSGSRSAASAPGRHAPVVN